MSLDRLRYPVPKPETFTDEIPIGFYMPWEKTLQGNLPEWFVECNGQLLDDTESPLNGTRIPNLNGIAKTKNVTFTDASTTATMSTTSDIYAGASITSTNVAAGTVVLSINSGTTITLSKPATATGTVSSTVGGNGGVFLRGGATSGVWQADQMQRITGLFTAQGGNDRPGMEVDPGENDSSGAFQTLGLGSVNANTSVAETYEKQRGFNSALSPDARAGANTWDETRPMNHGVVYVMKIKLTKHTKLITGYNINGDAFHTFQAGNPSNDDTLVFYDQSTESYKKTTAVDIGDGRFFPEKVVMMYDGSDWVDNATIPGWYACIAENAGVGCPNLVDRFVMGKVVSGSGSTGGANSVSHTHTMAHTHNFAHTHGTNSQLGTITLAHSHTVNSHVHRYLASSTSGTTSPYVANGGNSNNTQVWRAGFNSSGAITLWPQGVAGGIDGRTNNPGRFTGSATAGTSSGLTNYNAGHSHTTNSQSTSTTGASSAANTGSTAVDNRPAFYSMIFIRKCA